MRLRLSARLEGVLARLVLLIGQLLNEPVILHLFVLDQLLVQARRDLITAPPDHVVFEVTCGCNHSLLLARLILRVITDCKLNALRVRAINEAVLGLKVRFLRTIQGGGNISAVIGRLRNTDSLAILESSFDSRTS